MSVLNKFFKINRNLCRKVKPYLPQAKMDVPTMKSTYEAEVARHMNSRPEQIVVDFGGGKSCPFANYREPSMRVRIVAVDISEEEMKENHDVDEKRTIKIGQGLPFGPEEVDLVVSSWVLEHLENVDAFVSDSKRTLRKGGYFIHLLPSKFAPFALLNQALPRTVSKMLLSLLHNKPGFPAFYDNCYYSAIKALLERHDFKVMKIYLSYYQSNYFNFFFPLFIISALYEVLLYALGVKNTCAFMLVVARKR